MTIQNSSSHEDTVPDTVTTSTETETAVTADLITGSQEPASRETGLPQLNHISVQTNRSPFPHWLMVNQNRHGSTSVSSISNHNALFSDVSTGRFLSAISSITQPRYDSPESEAAVDMEVEIRVLSPTSESERQSRYSRLFEQLSGHSGTDQDYFEHIENESSTTTTTTNSSSSNTSSTTTTTTTTSNSEEGNETVVFNFLDPEIASALFNEVTRNLISSDIRNGRANAESSYQQLFSSANAHVLDDSNYNADHHNSLVYSNLLSDDENTRTSVPSVSSTAASTHAPAPTSDLRSLSPFPIARGRLQNGTNRRQSLRPSSASTRSVMKKSSNKYKLSWEAEFRLRRIEHLQRMSFLQTSVKDGSMPPTKTLPDLDDSPAPEGTPSQFVCGICYVNIVRVVGLCGHTLCVGCFQELLQRKSQRESIFHQIGEDDSLLTSRTNVMIPPGSFSGQNESDANDASELPFKYILPLNTCFFCRQPFYMVPSEEINIALSTNACTTCDAKYDNWPEHSNDAILCHITPFCDDGLRILMW